MNEFSGNLAKRLIVLVVLFSSLVTIATTSIQLYLEYQRDVSSIQTRLNEIKLSYLKSISETVWVADKKQLQILLDGILQLPDLQYIAVSVEDKLFSNSGTPDKESKLKSSTDLTHLHLDNLVTIGKLTIQAHLRGVYQRLWDRVWIILVSNAVKTFFVAIFIYYLFAHLITRHIATIAQYARKLTSGRLDIPLSLDRHPPKNKDELDELLVSMNKMRYSLFESFKEVEKTHEEIREHRDHLEEKVEERTRELEAFSYSVSHDLRAPLRTIDGYSHILLTDHLGQLDDEAIHYLNRMRLASQNMGELIDDLLELSKVSRMELNKQPLDLNLLAQQTFVNLRETDPKRHVQFEAKAQNAQVHADERLIRIVLENLIGNAWKYTGETAGPCIEFGSVEQDNQTWYYVKDNGAGFDMNYVDKIFGAFQRLHRNEEFPGTGIGLATVKRILRRHNGQIRAESKLGDGATFYFCF